MSENGSPDVPIKLELPRSAAGQFAEDADVLRAIEEALTEDISELMSRLGIPGSPTVAVTYVSGDNEPNIAVRPFHLTVNGRRCRLPAEDVQRVIGYVRGQQPEPRSHLLGLADVVGQPAAVDAASQAERLVEFLRLACGHAVRRNPPALLGAAQLDTYADALEAHMPDEARRPDRDVLGRALGRMLILRISIADHEAVAAVMAETADESVAAEELITRFSSSTIELQAPQEFLDELFRDSSVDVAQLMSDFRDAVTDQLGLTVPAIEPVPCADLHDRAFRFKVNDMAGLPWIGLPPDKCLVGAEPAALELFEIRAEPALHPAAGTAASAIAQEDRLSAEALDLWVWGPMEHVLMCLGATLRAHAGCMIHWGWVEEALDSFGHYSPALNDAVRADLPPRQLVGLLRRLVAEGLSIGNLPLVLDLRLEYEAKAGPWPVCAQSSAASLTGDVSAPDAESFVRSGMPRSTLRRWRASADTSELPAIMVDAALEALLETRAEPWLDEGDRDRLLDHLQEEVDFVPAGRGMPVLITSPGARAPLRKIVAQEFPKMGVLSRLELPPEAVLQPLGQLRLT